MIEKRHALGAFLVSVGILGLLALSAFQPRYYNIDQALNVADRYLTSLNNPDLAIREIMEFKQNYYVMYYEKSTGIGAFEMLIDKSTGRIFPEYGPNMMWNTKYGHAGMMAGRRAAPSGQMPITQSKAVTLAQQFLDRYHPGAITEDVQPFYGYYTIDITRDGKVYGMLSVNGYDGEVWYHSWHGTYIQSLEVD